MEFSSRVACIKYYQEEYPNLPRYMIEMALDYDLSNGGTSNEKPLTGKQKRKQKQMKKKVEKSETPACRIQNLYSLYLSSGPVNHILKHVFVVKFFRNAVGVIHHCPQFILFVVLCHSCSAYSLPLLKKFVSMPSNEPLRLLRQGIV
jgi:hypothetical protein